MGFKDASQRKFLFAMDKDKQKGINPMEAKSNSMAIPTSATGQITQAPQTFKLGAPGVKQFHAPVPGSINPTSVPSLPALPKMPHFGRVKQYLKPKKAF